MASGARQQACRPELIGQVVTAPLELGRHAAVDDHGPRPPDHGRWRPMTTIVMSSAGGTVPRNSATASRSAATMSCADPRRAASMVVNRRGSPNRSPDGADRVGHPVRVQDEAVAGPKPDLQFGRAQGPEGAEEHAAALDGVDRSAVARHDQRWLVPGVGHPQPPRGDVQHAGDRGDEEAAADLRRRGSDSSAPARRPDPASDPGQRGSPDERRPSASRHRSPCRSHRR